MTRQHPFEVEIAEALHGFGLLRPRVPRNVSKRRESAAIVRPRQMIAGKEKFVPVEENDVAARVARHWDGEEVLVQRNRLVAVEKLFRRDA